MTDDCDPTLWLSRAEQLLQLPLSQWGPAESKAAVELLETGVELMRCKAAVPKLDAQAKLVERANCLARCAEDLATDIVKAIPSIQGG